MKTCSKCHRSLDESLFVKSPRYKDGLYPHCKDCRREKRDRALAANPLCSRCGKNPHTETHAYCYNCLREVKGQDPVPKFRRDSNNTEMCSRCKVNLRLPYHRYCESCKNASTREWAARHGGEWNAVGPEARKRKVARRAALHRVQRGKMERKPCEVCGAVAEMHHYQGYEGENAFVVKWLCEKHHMEAHGKKSH